MKTKSFSTKFSLLLLSFLLFQFSQTISLAQTSDEWAEIAEEYLNMDPPQIYEAADAFIFAGKAAIDEDDYYAAKDYFNYALSYGAIIGDNSIKGRAYDGLGDVAEKWGHYDEAITNYVIAALAHIDSEDYMSAGWSYIDAGGAACEKGDYEKSKEYLLDAAFNFEKGGYKNNVAFSYVIIGFCAHELELVEESFKYLEMGAEKYIETDDFSSAGAVYEYAGEFAKELGDCELALEYWNKAKTNYNKAGEEYELPSCEFEVIVESPLEAEKYYQGDAITVKGRIEIGGEQIVPYNKKVTYELMVPGSGAPKSGRMQNITTDDEGNFSVMPFAGWNTGEYIITISAKFYIESKKKYVNGDKMIAFEVVAPPYISDFSTQINQIEQLYKSSPPVGIPWGPIHDDPPTGVPECLYGSYTNIRCSAIMAKEKLSFQKVTGGIWSDFACGAYQGKVMRFFNRVRFNEDPNIRQLMRGLDYGPVARGIPCLTSHHAVVLYPIGTEWHPSGAPAPGRKPLIFDPWPRQKPVTCTIQSFAGGMGFVRADEPSAQSNNIFSGYPISNAVICVNDVSGQKTITSKPRNSVLIECPVKLLVTDSEGNRLGYVSDNEFVEELPAHIYHAQEDGVTHGWYLDLPENNYDITITGTSNGTFRLQICGDIVANQYLDYGEQPITVNTNAQINLDSTLSTPLLILNDGSQISPDIIPVGVESIEIIPSKDIMLTNYPNPFNSITNIKYFIKESGYVKLDIFNILGKLVNTISNEYQSGGWHSVEWNGKDFKDNYVSSGIYFCRLRAGKNFETNRIMFLK